MRRRSMTSHSVRIAKDAARITYGAGVWTTYEGDPRSSMMVAAPPTKASTAYVAGTYRPKTRVAGISAAKAAGVPTRRERLATRGHGFGSDRHAENIVVRMPNRSQGASEARKPTAKRDAATTCTLLSTRRRSGAAVGVLTPISRVAH